MKKILIQGTSRTATKLYRTVLNRVPNVYIQHEINFDFRWKKDIHSVLKKHGAYNKKENIRPAMEAIYNDPFFKRVVNEYPDKNILINALEKQEKLTWGNVLNVFLQERSKIIDKQVTGAKNPVHFSYTRKVMKEMDDVRVLYLLRDPRAMYASELYQKMTKQRYSKFPQLKIRFLQRSLIFFHTTIEWVWAVSVYNKNRKCVVLCRYERLVNEPEELFKDIFSHCDLPFSKEYLDDLSVINSSHKVSDKGISNHGIDKWRQKLNAFERFWFKTIMKFLDYKY